ncbi:protein TRIGALACTOSYLDIACYLGLYCEROL 4 chloroplastic-like, partial [Trifolium medium]|nr:protein TRIGALACTOSYLDIACYLGLYCEROL 4 chloroplastic-like [Trifolium medium]
FVFLLGQFNLQKFVSSVKSSEEKPARFSSWLKSFGRNLRDKSLYALGLCSEFQLTPDDTLLFGLDSYDYADKPRGKAVFRHKNSMSLVFDEELRSPSVKRTIPFVLLYVAASLKHRSSLHQMLSQGFERYRDH